MKKRTGWGKGDLVLLATTSFLVGLLVALVGFICFYSYTSKADQGFQIQYDVAEAAKVDSESPFHLDNVSSSSQNFSRQRDKLMPNSDLDIKEKDYQLWEATTVVRNALYQYVIRNGQMPSSLQTLTKVYPQNYITSIPKNPINNSDQIASAASETAGWIYKPMPVVSKQPSEIKQLVKQALVPTLEDTRSIEFEPLKLVISKEAHTIALVSGHTEISNYPVALGKDGKTPIGEFSIEKKLVNPNASFYNDPNENPYGTRALALSDPTYAIHGTNEPEKIGLDVSNGCIRLTNNAIESLYAKVSLYTPVTIVDEIESSNWERHPTEIPTDRLYNKTVHPKEEDPSTFFHWAG